jgi:hypothetical protein
MGEGRRWGLLGGAIQDIEEVGVGLGVVRRGAKEASALLVRLAVLTVPTAFFKWGEGENRILTGRDREGIRGW